MTAFERLINTGYHLDIFRWENGIKTGIGVSFDHAEVKEGAFLAGIFGSGTTLEEACEDYIHKLSGKTLVFNAMSGDRKEVLVI